MGNAERDDVGSEIPAQAVEQNQTALFDLVGRRDSSHQI